MEEEMSNQVKKMMILIKKSKNKYKIDSLIDKTLDKRE